MASGGVHVSPVRVYVLVFLALMLGTAITVWAAYLDLGALNNVVMLGIAVVKATLVVLYFMHVRHSSRMTTVTVLSGVFFLLILFGLLLSDYSTRGWLGVAGK
jgi:cytochrome c oxidase subunit 4